MTVFLYLNDVEEGGGTDFPDLGITVQPKRGRALLWPSVKNEDPDEKDPRTMHQALPVKKGVKYGANAVSTSNVTWKKDYPAKINHLIPYFDYGNTVDSST